MHVACPNLVAREVSSRHTLAKNKAHSGILHHTGQGSNRVTFNLSLLFVESSTKIFQFSTGLVCIHRQWVWSQFYNYWRSSLLQYWHTLCWRQLRLLSGKWLLFPVMPDHVFLSHSAFWFSIMMNISILLTKVTYWQQIEIYDKSQSSARTDNCIDCYHEIKHFIFAISKQENKSLLIAYCHYFNFLS